LVTPNISQRDFWNGVEAEVEKALKLKISEEAIVQEKKEKAKQHFFKHSSKIFEHIENGTLKATGAKFTGENMVIEVENEEGKDLSILPANLQCLKRD